MTLLSNAELFLSQDKAIILYLHYFYIFRAPLGLIWLPSDHFQSVLQALDKHSR